MKNPMEKGNNYGMITAIVIGGIAVAGLACLFLTDDGEELLSGLKHRFKEMAKDVASVVVSDKTGVSKKTVKKTADVVVE